MIRFRTGENNPVGNTQILCKGFKFCPVIGKQGSPYHQQLGICMITDQVRECTDHIVNSIPAFHASQESDNKLISAYAKFSPRVTAAHRFEQVCVNTIRDQTRCEAKSPEFFNERRGNRCDTIAFG